MPHEHDRLAERLRAAFDQSPVSTVVYDAAGRPVAANAAFERLWGARLADVPPTYSILADPQLEAAGVLPLVRRAFAGEAVVVPPVRYDVASLVGRGRTLWAQAHLYPLRGAAGQVDEVVLTHEDVTAKRDAEAALALRTAELERSNALLQEQEARHRLAIEAAQLGTWTWDFATDVATFDARVHALFAFDHDGPTPRLDILATRIHPDDRERVAAALASAADPAGAGRYEAEYRVVRPDGSQRWALAAGMMSFAGEGAARRPARLFGTVLDITARKEAEAAVAESERQFRAIADALPTLAWTARADGYIDWYNARWYEYTGTTPAAMAGWGWQSVHDAAVLPEVLVRWGESIATGAPFEMTFPLLGADGRFRPFLTRVTPVRDAAGTITRWFGTNTDVAAERGARDAAERAAARAERLQALTAAFAAATTIDEVAAIVVAEIAADTRARTGLLALRRAGSDDVVIVRQSGLSAPGDEPPSRVAGATSGPAAECLRTGAPIFVETRDGPDGLCARFPGLDEVWERLGAHAVATVPLVAASQVVGVMSFTFGEPRAFPPTTRDFLHALGGQAAQATERVRLLEAEHAARAEAEAARARADEANRAKSQFLTNMSHELRTPLNAIGGYAELMELGIRGPVTDEQRRDLGRIQASQRHLLGLINDVLNLARIETGRVEYDLQPVELAAIVADVAPMIEPQLTAKGLRFAVSAPPAGLAVWADADKLRQVLLNLLSNAAKFTNAGGHVALEVAERADGSTPPGAVFVRVTDTGRGIRRDKLEAVFEPFVQLARHLTSPDAFSQQGTGLGLSISRDLARGMGGDLRARSTEGHGSSFTLTLRRAET